MKSFYSNGKLLLTGEYAVLDGAKAWAIPTKFGQLLTIKENTSAQLFWKSFDEKGNIWFQGSYDLETLTEMENSGSETSRVLSNILKKAQGLNPSFLNNSNGYEVETRLDFPRNWGLGTSSTLINNIADWANVDPYTLLKSTFGGSGYDIACAQYNMPILFQIDKGLPFVQKLNKDIPFTESLYFVHLNQKKNSREAIFAYRDLEFDKRGFVERISLISQQISVSKSLREFEDLIKDHEKEVSKALGLMTVKSELFADYWGGIKSLGAWGGDFVLATGNDNTPDYFKKKGYTTVISFDDMIL